MTHPVTNIGKAFALGASGEYGGSGDSNESGKQVNHSGSWANFKICVELHGKPESFRVVVVIMRACCDTLTGGWVKMQNLVAADWTKQQKELLTWFFRKVRIGPVNEAEANYFKSQPSLENIGSKDTPCRKWQKKGQGRQKIGNFFLKSKLVALEFSGYES